MQETTKINVTFCAQNSNEPLTNRSAFFIIDEQMLIALLLGIFIVTGTLLPNSTKVRRDDPEKLF